MSNELKMAAVPMYCKRRNIPIDDGVIGTDDFERWFVWFFEEPELEQMDIADLTEDEMPH